MPTNSKNHGGSPPNLSYVYYLATEPGKKHVRKLVDMDVPLPSMTWFRNPIHKPKDARMESLRDTIELYLKELSDDSSSSHHLIEVGPSACCSILPHTAIISDDEGDADEETTIAPLPRRRRRSTRTMNRTTEHPKRLPRRSATVPSRIYLETSSHTASTPTSSSSTNTNGRSKRRPPKVSSRSSTTARYRKSTKIVQ
jgi:hypothetical protein